MLRDGYRESIKEFWLASGLNPAQDFYADPDDKPKCWICGWATEEADPRLPKRPLDTHIQRKKHQWKRRHTCKTARRDIRRDKMEARQQTMEKVKQAG